MIMPLTARHVDGRRIDSTDDEQWAEVHVSRYEHLRCPECSYGMYARKSGKTVRHFAHKAGRPDTCSLTAAESAEHLHTKVLVAEAVRTLGWTAEIECPGPPGSGWRADVLATSPSGQRRIAFEPQFARIHESTARERSQRHQASDVETVWLDARGQESLADLSRGRLFYDERDPRVYVQTFEGGHWRGRKLPLGIFVQRVCLGQLTRTEGYWASERDRQAAAQHARDEQERRAEAERQAQAVREWHRRHAEEQEARRRREAEAEKVRREQDQERQQKLATELRAQRELIERADAARRLAEQRTYEAQREEQERRRLAEQRIAQAQHEEQEKERRRKQQEAEAARRETEPWHFVHTMSDKELLALARWYLDKPKPFPDWIPAGDRIHGALARRGLLHD